MSAQIPPETAKQIGECLFAGRKIEAIKIYRSVTNADLAAAKGAVERLEAELRAADPGRFTAAPAGRGCASSATALAIAVGVALFLLLKLGA